MFAYIFVVGRMLFWRANAFLLIMFGHLSPFDRKCGKYSCVIYVKFLSETRENVG